MPKLTEKLKDGDKETVHLATEAIKLYGNTAKKVILREFMAGNITIDDLSPIYKNIGFNRSDLDVIFDKYDHLESLAIPFDAAAYVQIVKDVIPQESEIAADFFNRILGAAEHPEEYKNDLVFNYNVLFIKLGQGSMEILLGVLRSGDFKERIMAAYIIGAIGNRFENMLPELEKTAQLEINNDLRDLLNPLIEMVRNGVAKNKQETMKPLREMQRGLGDISGVRRPEFKPMAFDLKGIVQFFVTGIANRQDESIRSASRLALKTLGEAALPQLVEALGTDPPFSAMPTMNPTSPMASAAWDTLEAMGSVSIPYLVDALYPMRTRGFLTGPYRCSRIKSMNRRRSKKRLFIILRSNR